MPAYSAHDRQLLKELRGLAKVFVARPEDDDWLSQITPRPDLLLSQATKRGSLIPLGGGRYVPRSLDAPEDDPLALYPLPLLVAARVFPQPCVLAYRSALLHHGLVKESEVSGPATFAVRGLEGVRMSKLGGRGVRLVRVDYDRFFGHESADWRDEGWLGVSGSYQVTDLERTLVDCLDKPRLSGSPDLIARVFKRAFSRADKASGEKVAKYAMDLGHSQARRAAFWLDRVGESAWTQVIMRHERIHEEMIRDRHRLPGRATRGRPRTAAPLLHPVLLDSTDHYRLKGQPSPDLGLVVNVPGRVARMAEL